ncbi:MAG: hypothetical protein ACKVS9_06165 [Phycisphaerae bacterium]
MNYGAPPGADPATVAVNEFAAATERRKVDEARSLARIRLQRLRHSADDIVELTKAFEREHDEWASLTTALLIDERGKRLAADADAVQAFRTLTQIKRPGRILATQVREQLATLTTPLDAALKADDSAYLPSDELAAQIDRDEQRVTDAMGEYQRPRSQIEGLVSATAGRTGTDTLAAVIERFNATEARSQASAIAVEQRQATIEVRQQVAEAEGTKVREIGKSETERVKAEEDAEQARIGAEALRTRQQGERDRVLKLAKDPAVQARFAPFLSPGRRYPARYEGSVRWLERKPWGRTPPRPVSLRELKTGGVLDNLQCFVVAATSSKSKTSAQNDRPHWPMPTTQAEWEKLQGEFELFQQLAPVWIELQAMPSE